MYKPKHSFSPFPQNVNIFTYPKDINFYLKEIQTIRNSYPNKSKSPYYSDIIYSTDPFLFQKFPQFNNLQKYLEKLIQYNYNFKPDIFNSWININPKHTFVSFHHHSPSLLSGICYLQIPPDDPGLNIHNKFNVSETIRLKIFPKDIIIFEGDQPHSTFPNSNDQEKIAIAFNIKKLE